MSRFFGKTFWFSLVFVSNALLVENIALATEITTVSMPNPAAKDAIALAESQPEITAEMEQVTSVSQLSDVQPTDWAFQALQSLVERYGCIAGYPDGTFRGNRALTRYEFAAGLNACLDRVNRLIANATANLVTKEDLAIMQKLQEEFAAELATLQGRVDALEARTTELEANQFSTTTKLNGEAIFQISDTLGKAAVGHDKTSTNLGYLVRLNFDTSFTGKDLLKTRLEARNIASTYNSLTGTPMTHIVADGSDGSNGSQIVLDRLSYKFPLGDKTTVEIAPKGILPADIHPFLNPYLGGYLDGSISRFGSANPTIYDILGESGIGINHRFADDKLNLSLSYLTTSNAANPSQGNGLFNGSYSAIAQLTYSPSSQLDVALSYARTYSRRNDVNLFGGTGSNNANGPFGQAATRGNHYGLEANWQPSTRFALSGWVGYAEAKQLSGGDAKAGIWNGAIILAFPDLFKEGNLGSIVVGIPPKVTQNDIKDNRDNATSLHIEAMYRLQMNDFISLTPGFFVITKTDHNKDNGTTWVGVLRTTFVF
jgi:hypothetical protein